VAFRPSVALQVVEALGSFARRGECMCLAGDPAAVSRSADGSRDAGATARSLLIMSFGGAVRGDVLAMPNFIAVRVRNLIVSEAPPSERL